MIISLLLFVEVTAFGNEHKVEVGGTQKEKE